MKIDLDTMRQMLEAPYYKEETASIRAIVRMINSTDGYEDENINLAPDYQRDHVWTEDQSARYLGHLMEGGQVPPIWIHRNDDTLRLKEEAEVIDGRQRMQSLILWHEGKIPAELSNGERIYRSDLTPDALRVFEGVSGGKHQIRWVNMTRKERLQFYVKLNRGGTVHTDAEIEKVRNLLEKEL